MSKQTEAMKLAREAGLFQDYGDGQGAWWVSNQSTEALAELVRADERAKLAEQPAQQEPVAWPIETNNQVELLAKQCGWDNRRYMTPADYQIWCDRMRQFVQLASPQAQPARQPLTDEQIDLFINGRGDEDDDDYVEPTGDGFGLTDADLVRLARRVEAAHGITKGNT